MLVSIFILCSILQATWCQVVQYRQDKVQQRYGSQNYNAVELDITDRGVQHLTSALGNQFLEAAIQRMDFGDVNRNVFFQHVTITGIRVTNFKKSNNRYNVKLIGGNRLTFDASNLQVITQGTLIQRRLFLRDRVRTIRMTLDGLRLSLTLSVERGTDGYPHVVINQCGASVGSFSAYPKIVEHAAKTFRMMSEVRSKICEAARPAVDRILGDIFKRQPLILRFTELFPNLHAMIPKTGLITGTISNQLRQVIQNTYVDLRMTKNPQLSTNNGASVFLKGDVLWGSNGVNVVPFGPHPLPNIQNSRPRIAKMAQVAISNYMINSLFYQTMKNVGLKFTLNFQQLPNDFREMINIYLPQLGPQYANSNRRLEIGAIRPPVVTFSRSKINLFADFHISLFADQTEMFKILVDFQTDATVQVSNSGVITGSVVMPTVTGQLKKSIVKNFNQEDVNRLADLAAIVAVSVLNDEFLKKGVKLPENRFFNFYNVDMKLDDRFLLIGTDFTAKSIF